MPQSTPTIRDIAKITGLSKATVANALNGSPTVAATTRERVCAAAAEVGYQRNSMVGAFMSALRRSRGTDFQGVLAAVEILEPERSPHGPFHQALVKGCQDAAGELGLRVEYYPLSFAGTSPRRLNSILRARGIRGLIILPMWRTPDFTTFDWSFLSGIYTDYIPENPVLNAVCCDHYRTIFELLQQLHRREYRRPGMFLEAGRDDRVHYRAVAALRSYQALHPETAPVPPLISTTIDRDDFSRWIERERPDVVLTHDTDHIDWIRGCGIRVPEDIGYVALNLAKAKRPCAALDLHPDRIGRCAVELLIAQIQRKAWGLPRFPTTTTIIGECVAGVTVR